MYALSDPERTLLHEIWAIVNDRWWGPQPNEYFASHQDQVEVYDNLMVKGLVSQNADSHNVFRMKFMLAGFFYLDENLRHDATKATSHVIAGIKNLYSIKKGGRATIAELAREAGISAGEAFRALFLMHQFGLSVPANLEEGPDSMATFLAPGMQVGKITSFEALYDQRKKEHDLQAEQMKRWAGADYALAANAVVRQGISVLGSPGDGFDAERKELRQENLEVPVSIIVFCERCNHDTNHKILGQVKQHDEPPEEHADLPFVDHEWQIIRCLGCDETRFRYWVQSTEFYILDDPEAPDNKRQRSTDAIYPTPQRRKPKNFSYAPDVIRSLYLQSMQALNGSMLHLCAGGMRATLDAICGERGIDNGRVLDELSLSPKLRKGKEYRSDNLEGKIWGLAEAGLITNTDAAILHKHRILGNDALHSALAPTNVSLEHAMNVVEHILETIYEVPGNAAKITLSKK